MDPQNVTIEDLPFTELRRKVRAAEVLSSSVDRLLKATRFTGRICVIVQNGQVLKSGYEESYFAHRDQLTG